MSPSKQKSKLIRKVGGILIIDGIRMRSPATIESDRPGQLKIIHEPKRRQNGVYKQGRSKNS